MPRFRTPVLTVALLLTGPVHVPWAHAAQAPATQAPAAERRAGQPPAPAAPATVVTRLEVDAPATRERLMELLRKHPPAVARVLKMDPSLMRNESYLAPYPQLQEFLAQHPDVLQNAPYYLDRVYFDYGAEPQTPRMQLVNNVMEGLAVLAAFAIGIGTAIWLIRTAIEQRRWSRLSKIQAEVHSKLMDRFSSNDELLSYVQTPSGRRFLESGPSPLPEGAPAMAAPFSRILWSVQAGLVLLVAGVGLLFVSLRTIEELSELFFIGGSVVTAVGVGFTVSAAASYALSRKLGLFERPAADHA